MRKNIRGPHRARPRELETPPAPRGSAACRLAVEKTSKTKHSIQINGKALAYTATAGTLILKKDDKPWASMFYVAYTRDDGAGGSETADYFRI